MPIYLLGKRAPSVDIPVKALSISISGSVDGAVLYVEGDVGQPECVRVNPHLIILPEVDTAGVRIGVEPAGATTFGDDTTIHLAVGPDSPGELDPDQVAFDAVNVAGAHRMELATLTRRNDRITVTACAIGEVTLSPLASMARTAARRRSGEGRHRRRGSLAIGVDASASMKTAFDDGSVAAAVDLITGVADVAGIKDVSAILVGARCTPVHASVLELSQELARTPVPWSAGARWSQLPDSERTVVVTDSPSRVVTANYPTLCIGEKRHLRTAAPLLAPPPAGTAADRHLSANPGLVDEIVSALLPVLS